MAKRRQPSVCRTCGLDMNQPADMLVELLRREKNAGIKPDEDLDVFMKALALEGKQTSLVAEYIMKILGLDICADTIVGDEMIKGISGGQKKRLTTGCANLGCYFSLSGFLTGMKSTKAKQMLKSIPLDRILLEKDAPDALPKLADVLVSVVPVPSSDADIEKHRKDSESQGTTASNESLNRPENIYFVLKYVASLLEMPEAELAELSYKNATKLFSYPCSKIHPEAEAIRRFCDYYSLVG